MTDVAVCLTREITERTEEYLIQHPCAKTCEHAKNCAISEAALYSAFHKALDVTLNKLRNNLLPVKAKNIPICIEKQIEYISDVLRFRSTSYFIKKFKQYLHMTPAQMRKKHGS